MADSLPALGGDAANITRYSSSPELSSPPRSLSDPDEVAAEQLRFDSRNAQESNSIVVDDGVDAPRPKRKYTRKASTNVKPEGETAEVPKKTRAKRVPKELKDPAAPKTQRKRKSAVPDEKETKAAPGNARQSKLAEINSRPSEVKPTASADTTFASQKSKIEDIPRPITSFFSSAPPPPQQQQQQQQPAPPPIQHQPSPQLQPQPPPPRTSGQAYDPIRSSNYDPIRETMISQSSYSTPQMSPKPPMINRASASPSISSLVDPPNQAITSPNMASQSFFNMQNRDGPTSVPPSPTTSRLAPSPMLNSTMLGSQPATNHAEKQPEYARASAPPAPVATRSPAVEAAQIVQPLKKASPMIQAKSTNSSSTGASPKTTIEIEPPPLPGSGLGRNGPDDGTESRAPTIILHIPLNGETNKYVNFTRLAEDRYGWDALHPRLAAQRERLARVAAAGAALEKNGSGKESGDEMSLDQSEGENSNVEMGGMSDGRTGTDGGVKKPVRKRKTKEDEYDKEDGFVDDSEMLWEEQQAASKDGFFVYSGPLVPEGEKPQLERSEPAKRGRGGNTRGRGAGRGGTTSTRGGGPGSRGGLTTRKPRITKADRARLEQEKAEREKQGLLAAKPTSYNNMVLSNPTAMGGQPMVFNHS